LLALVRDRDVTAIVVEHRDQFAGFGVEYIEAALSAPARMLVVVEVADLKDDLVRDRTGLLMSLCARPCGRGVARNKAAAAMNAIRAA
jgi:predicted site-specific integrase-resolvase